jgi:hypothetical protein
MTRAQGLKVLAMAGLLAGCVSGGDGTQSDDGDGSGNGNRPRTPGQFVAANAMARLTRADSCEDLLAHIQNDISAKIELRAEAMRDADAAQNAGGGAIGRGPIATPGVAPPAFGNPSAPSGDLGTPSMGGAAGTGGSAIPPAPSPMTPANSGGETTGTPGTGTGNLGPTDHSNTNVQVEGVDEADIVKTDGSRIYLLHGNELFVLNSWPADAMEVAGRIDVEGRAVEMFVDDGVAAVFSLVYDQGDLVEQRAAVDGAGIAAPYYYGSPFTKITLIDTSGAQPVVQRQLLIEGNYLSSRLHGTTVRAVIQGGFRNPPLYSAYIEYQDPWGRPYSQQEIDIQVEAWRDRMIAAVEETTLSDWLPIEREIKGGALTEPDRRCTDFYAPSPGLTDYGLTNIVSFDIQDPESQLGGAIVLGSADEVYSNESVLLLAHRDWRWDQGLIERERTVLHQFALDGVGTTYTASGFVPGHIVDQFSIDERAGVVRIASSIRLAQNFVAPVPAIADAAAEQDDANGVFTLSRRTTDNRVIALKVVDGDALKPVGASEPLGHDGETIFSTRFIGDRGYVVTFRQRDPLIVLDLADPEQPTVLGEAVIPGFSDYMHPLDDDHLVTIGRDVDAQTGQDLGLMLQIFDVSDAANPRRTHGYRFSENGYSEANVNHKAFTFHRPQGSESALLAFPYVNHGYPAFSSSLEVFAVSADAGFDKLGAIDHTGLIQNLCGTYTDPGFAMPVIYQCVQSEVRRGLFIFGDEGDFVYSISNAGVLAHDMADLVTAVATVSLPMPDYSENRTFFGPTGGAVMGGAVPPSSAQPPVMTTPPAMGSAGASGGI